MYADLHCDTFYKCYMQNMCFDNESLHINRLQAGSVSPYIQVFAHYIPEKTADKLAFFRNMLYNSLDIIKKENMVLFTSKDDILTAEQSSRTLAVLSVEGGDFFCGDIESDTQIIRFLSENHIRFMSLCYNSGSNLCGGALSPETQGISDYGLDISRRMLENGIIPDVSHLNNKSASQLLKSGITAVATHSNCFSLCPHPRNLTDDNIRMIIDCGGLIGVNLFSRFLSSQRASITDVLVHITHILSLGGENTVAFGADFDGCDTLPDGICGLRDIHKLLPLVSHSEKLYYNNVKQFLTNHS